MRSQRGTCGAVAKIKIFNRTDLGNAEHFAACYKDKLRYDHLRGRWFIWNGCRWKPDDDGEVYRLAKAALRTRRATAEKLDNDKLKEQEIWHALKSESNSRIKGMLELAQKEARLADNGKSWDVDPWLLGCENGILDLRTGKLEVGNPAQRITKTVGFDYNPDAECPLWDRVFDSYWADEPEVHGYVRRAIGYSMTGLIHEQCLFALHGLGENGKSTFLAAIQNALGSDYAYAMPFTALEAAGRSAISNDIAELADRRFVWCSETNEDVRLNEGRIKALTGDSRLTARFLHKNNFTFTPSGKFWLAFNHKPRIYDDTHGFWRRIRLVPMEKVFTDADRIEDLEYKLMNERPGVLSWVMRACLEWQSQRLFTPPVLQKATDQYRAECDSLADFLSECATTGVDCNEPKSVMYRTYKSWATASGQRPLGIQKFSQRMETKGFYEKQIGPDRTRYWIGVALADPPVSD